MNRYFVKFTQSFHQDIFAINDSDEDVIEEVLGYFDKEEMKLLKKTIHDILGNDEINLLSIWNNSKCIFKFEKEEDVRIFFMKAWNLLEQKFS